MTVYITTIKEISMATRYEKKEAIDHQQVLTNRIIEKIENILAGVEKGEKWNKPFFEGCNEIPINGLTGKQYKGQNICTLISTEYPDNRWATYAQLQELSKELDAPVLLKKGSKAEYIVKIIPAYEVNSDGSVMKDIEGNPVPKLDDNGNQRIGYKYYPVFNFSCVECEKIKPYMTPNTDIQPMETVQNLIKALEDGTNLKIVHSPESSAYYSPKAHLLHMPEMSMFKSEIGYCSTFFHESIHSTGPEMKRDMTGRFGEKKYAEEELVAQIGSAFLASSLGMANTPATIDTTDQDIAYMRGWLEVLGNDKTFITKASNQASKANDHIMGKYEEHMQTLTNQQEEVEKKVMTM